MSASLIKKISAKTVVGTVTAPEKATPLYTVMGIANGIKSGQSTYGEWIALTGQFEAMNLETGESVAAPQCFLPDPLQGMIVAKIRTPDDNGVTPSVRFAVEIGIKPAKSTLGYEYTVRELVDAQENDPLADLRKALPAPNAPEKDDDGGKKGKK